MSKLFTGQAFDHTDSPIFPTSMVGKTADGRLLGEDKSVWAYFRVPLNPVVDAKTTDDRLKVPAPLLGALHSLASLTHGQGVQRRQFQKDGYRHYQLLSINLDALFETPYDHPLRGLLDSYYHDQYLTKRLVLLGVKLIPSSFTYGVKGAIDSVIQSFQAGRPPMSDWNGDFEKVRTIMMREGLATPTDDEIALAKSWWTGGVAKDRYYMAEPDKLHLFSSYDEARRGQDLYTRNVSVDEWPHMSGHGIVTFAAVTNVNLPMISAVDASASWVSDLISSNAVCVAINGLLEPGTITAKEIDANVANYEKDVKDGQRYGKDSTAEQDAKLEQLAFMRRVYQGNSPEPISTGTSITVAFNGDGSYLDRVRIPACDLSILQARQTGAMAETWLCPTVRTNPQLHDLPLTAVAYSGICSLSVVGDSDNYAGSAFTGLTEVDRQIAWTHPGAAMTLADSPPLVGVFGMSGSGKTMFGIWQLIQFALLGHKTVFVDPKEGSDFSALFRAYGGESIDLGDIAQSDGILDPIRFSVDPREGINMAVTNLKYLDPWDKTAANREVALYSCLTAGVQAGARSTLSALYRARDMGMSEASDDLIRPIERVAHTVQMASALIGHTDTGPRLAFDNDLTLIKVGRANLDLPNGSLSHDISLSQRVAVSVLRMLVRGSTIAVRGEEGVVGLDEAWIFFDSAGAELESLGRLARSMSVAVWMMTQRVSDVEAANLDDFISTGYILSMKNLKEAQAACRLLRLEPTDERLRRIMAKAERQGAGGAVAFNYESLRALVDKETRHVERGSVCLYSDTADRAVYTEVLLPEQFLRLASTNRIDQQRSQLAGGEDVSLYFENQTLGG